MTKEETIKAAEAYPYWLDDESKYSFLDMLDRIWEEMEPKQVPRKFKEEKEFLSAPILRE